MSQEEELRVTVRLKDDLLVKFNQIKEFYGVDSDTVVYRIILNRFYNENKEQFGEVEEEN